MLSRRSVTHGRRLLGGALLSGGLITVATAPLTAYLAIITGAARRATRRRPSSDAGTGAPRSSFAVVIPAHDEERLIRDAVASVRAADYPAELVTVHVAADHCSDRTADVARDTGAVVHEHVDPEPRGKGATLRWMVDRLTGDDTLDAIVILDADSVVNPGFFTALDAALREGAVAVQAHYAAREPETSAATELRAAALALRHLVRPLGRQAIGGSCGLFGNGMAFRTDVLRRRSWSDHLTEDLEFQVDLLLEDDQPVAFAPDAVVWAEIPAGLDQARSQNERWERGRLQLARAAVPRLLRALPAADRRRRIRLLDTAFDLTVPPLSVLALGSVAGAASGALAAAVHPSRLTRSVAAAGALSCAGLAYHVIVGMRVAGVQRAAGTLLARAPRFMWWKVRLWARMVRPHQEVRWTRTARNDAASLTPDRGAGATRARQA